MITLTASAFLMLLINFLPSMFGKDSLWMLSPFPVKSPELEKIKKKIPENAVLSVQSNIGSHFSQRKFIFAYPAKVNEADYVILWMQDPNGIEIDNTFRFIHHMRMNQEDYLSSIKCLLVTRKFQIDYFNFPWLVLKRQSQATRISELPIVNYRLETLAQRWKIDNLNPSINQCIWTQ